MRYDSTILQVSALLTGNSWYRRVKREPEDTFSLTLSLAPPSESAAAVAAQPPEPLLPPAPEPPAAPPESVSANLQLRRAPSRSIDERAAMLNNDPRVASCDAHSVQCRLCGGCVRLHNIREYDLHNWNRHVESCEKKGTDDACVGAGGVIGSVSAPVVDRYEHFQPRPRSTERTYQSRPTQRAPKRRKEQVAPAPVTAPIPVPNPAPPDPTPLSAPVKNEPGLDMDAIYSYTPALKKKKGRNVTERMEGLRQDPRCGEVQPHQVFCLMCNRWIKLYREVEYIDSNWLRHAERCSLRMRYVVLSCLAFSSLQFLQRRDEARQ